MFSQPEPPRIDFEEQRRRDAEQVWRHHQSKQAGADLPFWQALITAGFFGLAAGAYCMLIEGDFILSLKWAFGVAVTMAVLSWITLLFVWLGGYKTLENILKVDLNHDGYIGEPEPPREAVRIEVVEDGGKRQQFLDLPVSAEKISDMASGLLHGQSFSEAAWSGSGALFSRAQFRQLRDEFLKRGWVEWRNPEAPGQGLILSRTGQAVMRHFSAMSENPPTLRPREW